MDYQKLRGGYYTPRPIADFLAQWAIRSPTDKVLEPSCGDGVLLEAAAQRLLTLGAEKKQLSDRLHGVELDPVEANKAAQRLAAFDSHTPPPHIHVGDFFTYCKSALLPETFMGQVMSQGATFDAVMGNPPFIRYQNFPEEHRDVAFTIMKEAGFKPTRLSNAWLPFLVVSTLLLGEHSRLALVIPAELFQVNYAAEARHFLSTCFSKLTLITFQNLVFEGIQQEVVLLLGEHNGDENTQIQVIELDNLEDLAELDKNVPPLELKPMDHSTEKWTQYFLSKDEILLLRALRNDPRLTISGDVIDVDVGVVTGQNKFFILTEQQVKQHSLEPYLTTIVARSAHLEGAIFTERDWAQNRADDYSSYLFTPPDVPFDELPTAALSYVQLGEHNKLHTGYKCRIRNRWYIVPSVWTPDAFMLRQIHGYPKLILNEAKATCTDTIHRVRFLNGAAPRSITAAFVNSLTLAFSEVTGRGYGGGVQTFEPSEAERLPLPLLGAENLDLTTIDRLLREDNIEAVLDITDEVLLIKGLGLSRREAKSLRGIWEKLRDRRINRKHNR
ncbi:MAG: SAM-dependent methyltransferase [Chloroflexi bacterium]|nr:SAM-dependent methyltransferase [Chloroflexota bacterium]